MGDASEHCGKYTIFFTVLKNKFLSLLFALAVYHPELSPHLHTRFYKTPNSCYSDTATAGLVPGLHLGWKITFSEFQTGRYQVDSEVRVRKINVK